MKTILMFYKKQKNVTKSYLTKTIQFQNGLRGEKNMESRNNLYFFYKYALQKYN